MKNVLLTFSNNQFLKKLFYILKKRSIKNDEKKNAKKSDRKTSINKSDQGN